MQGIEHCRLRVRQKRRAQKNVGVPERHLPTTQRSRAIITIGVKIEEDVAARQHTIGQEQPRIKRQHKKRQQRRRPEMNENGAPV